MRLWSISPSYLDRQGLLAVWREGLLAQSCLIKGGYSYCSECLGCGCVPLTYDLSEKTYLKTPSCVKCKGKGKYKTAYYNHPQLERFKLFKPYSVEAISFYLLKIWEEAIDNRNYNFNCQKIDFVDHAKKNFAPLLTVTTGQLEYEFNHLQKKLRLRDNKKYKENDSSIWKEELRSDDCAYTRISIKPHPLFTVVEGSIEKWEKVK